MSWDTANRQYYNWFVHTYKYFSIMTESHCQSSIRVLLEDYRLEPANQLYYYGLFLALPWLLPNKVVVCTHTQTRKKETCGPWGAAKFWFINVLYIKPNEPWPSTDIIMGICTKKGPVKTKSVGRLVEVKYILLSCILARKWKIYLLIEINWAKAREMA
jgi:hypothetical protein